MPRRLKFRGKTLEELKMLTINEFAKFLDARARRYIKKAPVSYRNLIEKVKRITERKQEGKEKIIKTHVREAVILPSWVGLKFGVHNGKEFKVFEITFDMVGRRLGEFSHTTGRVIHSGPGVGATRGSKFIPLK
ncbi:MAG: 30S ribosomal protein S19 [Candidatus Micrarchaeia archaeon]